MQCAQCVGTTDIAVDAITTGRLRNNAVTGAKIKDGAITESKLGAGAVTTSRIGLGAVREGRIANNAGTTPKIADGAITESKLGAGAVTNSRIAVGAVREGRIADGAVTNKKIGIGAVREGRIANGAVTAAKLGLANTTFVEDSENDTANCNALRAALNAAVSPAVVVLGPGTFACGTNPVVLPPGVGLIGSGRNVTDITGNIEGLDGLVRLTDDTSLSHLTVTNVAMTVNDVIVGRGIGTATVNARRWLIRVRLEMNRVFSGSCETAREELDAGEEDPGLGGLDGRLEVLGQPPVSIEPGERALDDPSAGQELEARHARGTVDDLQRPAADPLQCALELGPGMGAVGEDVAQAGKVAGDGGEHRRRAVAVLDVGAVDHDRDQQAAGVGEDVTLAALDFLSGVEAPDTAAFRGFYALTVDDTGRRAGRAALGLARRGQQLPVDLGPGAVVPPEIKLALHRRAWREVPGQHAPWTAATQ